MLAGGSPVIQDNFPGPGLTANGAWRKTTSSGGASAVQWVPPDIAYWLTWTTPDDAFEVFVADKINGPWTDATVGQVNGFSYVLGATRVGGVPAAAMPAGANSAAYFQLRK